MLQPLPSTFEDYLRELVLLSLIVRNANLQVDDAEHELEDMTEPLTLSSALPGILSHVAL